MTVPIKVLALTPGQAVPSARFRVRQYASLLRSHGVDLTELPARFGTYPPENRGLRPAWGAAALVERSAAALRSWHYDVTLFQREMIAKMVTAEVFTRGPRVLDVDDAIWLAGGESFARRLAGPAD